jgi:hypothetical protein
MTRYVENPIYCEAIKDFRDELADFPIEEVSLTTAFHCWKSKNFPHEIKICVLELFAERLEKDIELLNTQIQSYSFQHPKQFYEQLTSPKPKDIVSSFDFLIDESFVCKHKSEIEQLQSWSNIEDTNGKLIHVRMLNEYLENQQIDRIFIDPVANYMELLFSVTVQTCFFCKDPSYHQLPVHISVLIFIKHDEEAQSWDQLLGWLHWHFFIT